MADETTPATEPEQTEAPADEAQEEVSGASSLEEVEAYWRKRMSNSDKAHAAAEKALREKLEATSSPAGDTGRSSEVPNDTLKELQQRLQQAESRAQSAELKAKYPTAVEAVGDAAVHMDEARLASLNESLNFDAGRPTRIDSNNPSRSVGTRQEKSLEDKSVEELLADLRSMPFPSNQ